MPGSVDPSWLKLIWGSISGLVIGGYMLGKTMTRVRVIEKRQESTDVQMTNTDRLLQSLHTDTKLNTQAIDTLNTNLERLLNRLPIGASDGKSKR